MSTTTDTTTLEKTTFFIGGQWAQPAESGRIEVIDPSIEQAIGSVPEGTPADVDAAVAAARAAFETWSLLAPEERAEACAAVGAGLYRRQ